MTPVDNRKCLEVFDCWMGVGEHCCWHPASSWGSYSPQGSPRHRMIQPQILTALRLRDPGLEERSSCGPRTRGVLRGQNCFIMTVRHYLPLSLSSPECLLRGLPEAAGIQAACRSRGKTQPSSFTSGIGEIHRKIIPHFQFLFWKTQLFSISKILFMSIYERSIISTSKYINTWKFF